MRESYAAMPALTNNETQMLSVNGYVVAYKKMTTQYGMECIVVTLGYERFLLCSVPDNHIIAIFLSFLLKPKKLQALPW